MNTKLRNKIENIIFYLNYKISMPEKIFKKNLQETFIYLV